MGVLKTSLVGVALCGRNNVLMEHRFVTGLLDAEQDSKYKVSMYAKAQQIGLPALFVDIRHESAHGEMPSLTSLRDASERALRWLWDHYWENQELKPRERGGEVLERAEEEEQAASLQPGGWTQWEGPWLGKPIGIVS